MTEANGDRCTSAPSAVHNTTVGSSAASAGTGTGNPVYMPGGSWTPPTPIPSAAYNTKVGDSARSGSGAGSEGRTADPGIGSSTDKKRLIDKGLRDFVDHLYIYPDGSVGATYGQTNPDGTWIRTAEGDVVKGAVVGKIGLDGSFEAAKGYEGWAAGKSAEEVAAMKSKIDAASQKRHDEVMGDGALTSVASEVFPHAIIATAPVSKLKEQATSYVGNYAALEQKMWQDVDAQVPAAYEAALLTEYGPEYADYEASLVASRLTGLPMVESSIGRPRSVVEIIDDYEAAYQREFAIGWQNNSEAQAKSLADSVVKGKPPSTKIDLPAFQGERVSW